MTPPKYQPGIGLRPGGERPDLEPLVEIVYAALYESVVAHSRLGLNVVVDVGHHDQLILSDCARRLAGLPAILVGIRCPIETILARRAAEEEGYVKATVEDPLPQPVVLWQEAVHQPGTYDLEVDTSVLSPVECAKQIRVLLDEGIPHPSALERISSLSE